MFYEAGLWLKLTLFNKYLQCTHIIAFIYKWTFQDGYLMIFSSTDLYPLEQAQDFKERIVPDDVFKEKMVSKFQMFLCCYCGIEKSCWYIMKIESYMLILTSVCGYSGSIRYLSEEPLLPSFKKTKKKKDNPGL